MKNKWIHFSIDRESLIGMLSGVGIVILSVIMTIFNNDIANIILRDILMICNYSEPPLFKDEIRVT